MGFTPHQVDQMSLWEFQAAFAGWRAANAPPPKAAAPSAEDLDAALIADVRA